LAAETDQGEQATRRAGDGGAGAFLRGPQELFNHDAVALLEGFDFAASPKLPTAQLRDLGALRWLHAGESVILYGPVGVGKSHIAQSLGQLVIRQGMDVRFIKTSRALAHLAGGHADQTWRKRLAELTKPALLILDDWGMRELTAALLCTEQADTLAGRFSNVARS
jgi:DNA replication protein DnaC